MGHMSKSGLQVSSIATKTGTIKHAETDCRVVMEICDSDGNCCETTKAGRGLDNPGNDRESGNTDTYTDTALLGSCSEKVTDVCEINLPKQ